MNRGFNASDIALAAVSANGQSAELDAEEFNSFLWFLNITASSGTTPTLDIKLQGRDPSTNLWTDVPGAAFAQKTGTGTDTLAVGPGLGATANRVVSHPVPRKYRWAYTLGGTTPNFTFSITRTPG